MTSRSHPWYCAVDGRAALGEISDTNNVYITSNQKHSHLTIYGGTYQARRKAQDMLLERIKLLPYNLRTIGRAAYKNEEQCVTCGNPPKPCSELFYLLSFVNTELKPNSLDHVYCDICIRNKISTIHTNLPFICDGEGCGHRFDLVELKSVLKPGIFEMLLTNSYNEYIKSRPSEFAFCSTPDCKYLVTGNLLLNHTSPKPRFVVANRCHRCCPLPPHWQRHVIQLWSLLGRNMHHLQGNRSCWHDMRRMENRGSVRGVEDEE